MLHFEEVNPDNWRINLAVAESQKHYVADRVTTLARAYAYRNARSCALFVYDGEQAVGMVMYHDDEEDEAYILSEMFIDCRYQGRGYGREAVQMVLDRMRQDGKYQKVLLCYIEGNRAAETLYKSFGFRTIDRDEDEIIMELSLR